MVLHLRFFPFIDSGVGFTEKFLFFCLIFRGWEAFPSRWWYITDIGGVHNWCRLLVDVALQFEANVWLNVAHALRHQVLVRVRSQRWQLCRVLVTPQRHNMIGKICGGDLLGWFWVLLLIWRSSFLGHSGHCRQFHIRCHIVGVVTNKVLYCVEYE